MVRSSFIILLLLGLASQVLSACDFSNNYCDISNIDCPSTSTVILTDGSSTYSASNIDVISFSDIILSNSNLRGRVATRNNLITFNNFTTGDQFTTNGDSERRFTLIVGRSVFLNGSGTLYPSNSVNFVGDGATFDVADGSMQSCSSRGNGNGCLDSNFDSARTYWAQFSRDLAARSNNVGVSFNNGRATITCDNGNDDTLNDNDRFYVVTLNTNDLPNGFTFSGCSSDASLVINWVGASNFTFVGTQTRFGGSNNVNDGGYVIYNFPSASQVTIQSSSFYGTILAPGSGVLIDGSDLTGQIIANDLTAVNANVNQLTSCLDSDGPVINPEESSGVTVFVSAVMTVAMFVLATIL